VDGEGLVRSVHDRNAANVGRVYDVAQGEVDQHESEDQECFDDDANALQGLPHPHAETVPRWRLLLDSPLVVTSDQVVIGVLADGKDEGHDQTDHADKYERPEDGYEPLRSCHDGIAGTIQRWVASGLDGTA
jgi:hypothetical protein